MQKTLDNLAALLAAGESATVEFKTSFNQEAIEAICAFANKRGGIVFVGLKNSEKILGVQLAQESLQTWLNEIKSKTEPALIPEVKVLEYKGKTLVAFIVRENAIKPVSVQGRYFVRHENSNHVMSLTEISDSVLQTQNSSWDYVLDESGSLEDISLEKVSESIARINARGRKIPTDPMDFLRKNRLMRDGKLTFAAQMLFAKDWHVNTAVQMGRFIDHIHIKDRDEAHGDLVTQVDQLFGFVKKHINCAVVISGKPENDLVWDYPLEAIREIILNMVVHRDYRSASESCIKIFDDRIEFFNPGSLLDDMTVEDLLNNSYLSTLRNKAIANHFHELGEIEKYGSGVTRVLQMFREAGNPELKIEATGTGVKVTAFALGVKTTDEVPDKMPNKIPNKVPDKTGLSNAENKVFEAVKENNGCGVKDVMSKTGFSDRHVRNNLASLIEKKLIERRGSKKTGGYFVV